MVKIGDRVGAIKKADKDTVWIYGYGIFQGYKLLPDNLSLFPGHENPLIKLDNGKEIFGIQCWWASERHIKKDIGDRKIIECD
jgi:hypothetical protein